jgi:hypothetical protein
MSSGHARGSFRFKAVVCTFSDALELLMAMDQHLELFSNKNKNNANNIKNNKNTNKNNSNNNNNSNKKNNNNNNNRFSSTNVLKLDIAKMFRPKEWGWRFIALDLIFPNSQIVEVYIVFASMDIAKKCRPAKSEAEDAHTPVGAAAKGHGRTLIGNNYMATCHRPQLSNHAIFELWRGRDTTKLDPRELEQYEADKVESNRRYDQAWDEVESRTSPPEAEAL